ncbi:PREDICTED: BUB3-interacting and GLEBS motif-containing protein ZNF207 isoform X2 [Nicrophorus vespilloides]|uniref:BUB3-interacting and GLEBS motif-containing protein ZNF207 isoform X2 n=1 Tax=Nicrophorus vespilloides TaxID=110193 RepID=A0ABM1MPD2_NICVS|nr:PREDICTED: BUB3-interacting and GLEBS motif-containing protein ZNF207 isoform X2 [Nicrophorus vespilloides]
MGRKKKKQSKPWCWYCNREFEDEKILIQHQKAKHFKCHICHKKLYTGPGLSIHCMQVHKEAIDKVPNSLPNRSNIEIEIYGMEGIPQADLKEHERQKAGSRPSGSDDEEDDEPAAKKPKPEGLLGTAPGVMPGMPMMQGMMPPHMQGMPPGMQMGHMMAMGPMGPHFMHHGMPMMPPHMAMMQQQGGPPKPLFPSAVPSSSPSSAVVGADFKPITSGATISAPPTTNNLSASSSTSSAPDTSKVNTITTTSAASKIIHPAEDISLEEIRARHHKYKKSIPTKVERESPHTQSTSSVASDLAMAVSAAHQAAVRQQDIIHQAQAAMMQRFPPMRPPISIAGTPVSSMSLVAPMRPMAIPGPPTLLGGPIMRPPMGMPPDSSVVWGSSASAQV